MRLLKKLQPWLMDRRLPLVATFLALLLVLPSVWTGLNVDDYFHLLNLTDVARYPRPVRPFPNPFEFFTGDAARLSYYRDLGLAPWWTNPEIRIVFLRPLSTLTHVIDYALWPNHPALMHLHNLVWFGALTLLAALLYRRILGATRLAGLAGLLYALDDTHGFPAGWIANRNALVAAFFGLLSITAYDRWRRDGWSPGAVLAPLSLGLALLGNEGGAAAAAFLLAYALFLDQGAPLQRLSRLVPSATVGLVWAVAYRLRGFGAHGSGLYIDPGADPGRYALAVIERAPVLMLGALGFPQSDYYILPRPVSTILFVLGIAVTAVCAAAFAPLVKRRPEARFLAFGAGLALLPICATFTMDRLLTFVGFGTTGLVAMYLTELFQRIDTGQATVGRPARALATALVAVHLVLAPLNLPISALSSKGMGMLLEGYVNSLPEDPAIEHQTVVMVSAPDGTFAGYLPVVKALRGQPSPRRIWALAVGMHPLEVRRTDARTLVIRPSGGFLADPFSQLVRDSRDPMPVGYTVPLNGMTVEVTAAMPDGRPAEAMFRFDTALEDPSLRWMQWQGLELAPFKLPAVGEVVNIPAGSWM